MGLIYQATNPVNGKAYIGQTMGELEVRKSRHLKAAHNKNQRPYHYAFSRAIRKYGFDSFEWSVLFENVDSQEDLNWYEQWVIQLIDSYKSGYNMTIGGEASPVSNPEVAKRIANKNRGKKNPKVAKALRGRKLSEEHKRNMFHQGMKGKVHSEETKKKISDGRRGQSPWNKGLTIADERVAKNCTEKSKATRFQEGHVPWNRK